MHPRLLKTFLAVARHGNVTRAAQAVHLAQSSVSDQLQSLEAELDARLFTRSRQGLRLTPAGEALAAHAQDILTRVDEAKAAVAQAARHAAGTVVLGALETIAATRLAPWMAAFGRAQPGIALQLRVMGSAGLLRAVTEGELGAAFCFERGALDPRLAQRVVAQEPLVLAGAPGAAAPTVDSLAALAATAGFVATAPGCAYRHLFEQAFAAAGLAAPAPVAEVDSIRAIARLVAAGTGLALLPRLAIAAELARGELVELVWPGPAAAASLLMVWRRQRTVPPALARVLEDAGAALGLTPAGARPPRAAPCRS